MRAHPSIAAIPTNVEISRYTLAYLRPHTLGALASYVVQRRSRRWRLMQEKFLRRVLRWLSDELVKALWDRAMLMDGCVILRDYWKEFGRYNKLCIMLQRGVMM